MKKSYLIIVLIVVILIISITATYLLLQKETGESISTPGLTTNPFLWKIEGEHPSYLYGSIHLADEKVLTLPDVVFEALVDADTIYTETKLDKDTQLEAAGLSMLPAGESLEDLLPQDVETRLGEYLSSKGIASDAFSQVKIWSVATTLIVLEDIQNIMKNKLLDQYIWDLADSNQKNTEGLETVEEQINIFDTLSIDEQLHILNETLDLLQEYSESGESVVGATLNAYIDGDLQTLQELDLSDYDASDPLDVKLRTRLITDRNYNMSQRISNLVTGNPDTQFFFTIGAAHYYGEDGLIELLRAQGFTVTRVEFAQCSVCNCDSGEININQRCYVPYEQ